MGAGRRAARHRRLYQLDRTNTQAPRPGRPAPTVLTGAQRSRGLELGLERSISDRWQISAGYALQKAEITETTTAAPDRAAKCRWSRATASRCGTATTSPSALGVGLGIDRALANPMRRSAMR